tara:strand:- start:337 stop:537 length:201 start_codon:yes stop_codon:yes gene_type:complete
MQMQQEVGNLLQVRMPMRQDWFPLLLQQQVERLLNLEIMKLGLLQVQELLPFVLLVIQQDLTQWIT